MDDLLELETRRKIFELISKNPGLHLSKIAKILNMRTSLVEYHLLYLVKNEIITAVKESGYSRYYIKGEIGVTDKKVLSILRQEIPLKIVLYLLRNENSPHKDILKNFEISPSTLSYHLKKLVENDIISLKSSGDEKGYFVLNPEEIISILIQYKPYSVLEGFKDIWLDLKYE